MLPSTRTENRYSVCIGINTYDTGASLGELEYAEHDAEAVDALLGTLGFAPPNRTLLTGRQATTAAINDALATVILDQAGPNDLVVFYFAGHGVPVTINPDQTQNADEYRSEVFLAPYDFDRAKVKTPSFRRQKSLGMERVRREFFEGEGSRKRLFIFDSCYSGDFYGPRYRSETPDPVLGYIQHMLNSHSTGRVALSSCLPGQKARESREHRHGLMTYHLLRALRGEEPLARRPDGAITINTLFDYLADALPPNQRPVLSGVQHDIFTLAHYPSAGTDSSSEAAPANRQGGQSGQARSDPDPDTSKTDPGAPAVSPEWVKGQQRLLESERIKLSDLLLQKARVGGAFAQPGLLFSIREARAEIKKIKQRLGKHGVQVEYNPDDDEDDF